MRPKIVTIGIGNEYRGDDAIGLTTLRRLRAMHLPEVDLLETKLDTAGLLDAWKGYDLAIVIDAVCSGANPGFIHRLDPGARPLPAEMFRVSTHDFGLAEVVELARVLDRLPPRLIVYGIEGRNFAPGAGLSAEVEGAARAVAEEIGDLIKKDNGTNLRRRN